MAADPEFKGTERHRILKRVGAGSKGVVYEAYDADRDAVVALKTLAADGDADGIYRLKSEFRALADVAHENLVVLHEFFVEEDRWFFTMELVDGVSFLAYVQEKSSTSVLPFDEERLRGALLQLSRGLCALHARGILHRDLKPSNVMVDRKGRVVILDFGLAASLASLERSAEHRVQGTVAYMSPEQAGLQPLSEAADWYAVGVMLYESLTSLLPHRGTMIEVLMQRLLGVPDPPCTLLPEVPEDLNDLCVDLLQIEPGRRPSGDEVLTRLERRRRRSPARRASQLGAPISGAHAPLVGREAELARLLAAYQDSRGAERPVVVYLTGSSGMGKTALAQRFFQQLPGDERPLVLGGRCYEREFMPYKAVDALIDELGVYLRSLPAGEVAPLLSPDVRALVRTFPALARVGAIAELPEPSGEAPDSFEQRRTVFRALKGLFQRLATTRPLVLSIDDLHWGDADSGVLLSDLLASADAPPMLFVGSYRPEAVATPLLALLLEAKGRPEDPSVRRVELGPLTPADSTRLACQVLEAHEGEADVARIITNETAGCPLLIEEYARYLHERQMEEAEFGSVFQGGFDGLSEMILGRVAKLPEGPRRLLDLVAVSGRPLEKEVARAALDAPSIDDMLGVLAVRRLARTQTSGSADSMEVYHDRIRAAVLAGLTAESQRAHHLRLAKTLERTGRDDPEVRMQHYEGAGLPDVASRLAVSAADRAASALAFERAGALYRRALELGSHSEPERRALEERRGDALANAGLGADAAAAYLAAAEGLPPERALGLKQRAATQLFFGGRTDEGVAVLEPVLESVGVKEPRSNRGVIAALVFRRGRLRLRGLRFSERQASNIASEDLLRIDACWGAVAGLNVADPLRAAALQVRHVLLALESGEPFRVARALVQDLPYLAIGGIPAAARVERVTKIAEDVARRLEDPEIDGLLALFKGNVNFVLGRGWRPTLDLCDEAEAIFRGRCTGAAWHIGSAQLFGNLALVYLGELAELGARLDRQITDSDHRGDRLLGTNLRLAAFPLWLARSDPTGARINVGEALDPWAHTSGLLPHAWAEKALTAVELYEDAPERAHARVPALLETAARAQLLVLEIFRFHFYGDAANATLAAAFASASSKRGALLAEAKGYLRRLERTKIPYARSLARALAAGIRASEGRVEEAVDLLAGAEEGFKKADMILHAAAIQRRKGSILGGDEGSALVRAAEQIMREKGVKEPERYAATLIAGPP